MDDRSEHAPAGAADGELDDGDLEAVVGGLSRIYLPGIAVQRPDVAAPVPAPV
jgi:hypothetical protein